MSVRVCVCVGLFASAEPFSILFGLSGQRPRHGMMTDACTMSGGKNAMTHAHTHTHIGSPSALYACEMMLFVFIVNTFLSNVYVLVL